METARLAKASRPSFFSAVALWQFRAYQHQAAGSVSADRGLGAGGCRNGAARFTKDIDLLVDDAPDNVALVKRTLSVLAGNAAAEVADTDVRDYVVVRIADEVIVDLMGRACGLSYADVVADAEEREFGGATIRVASPATLIRTKGTCRPQDAIDRGFLEGVIQDRAGKP